LIRAFIGNLAQSGRPQGGSTITQVVKNLPVGEDLTYERKIREMIVAARVEAALSKDWSSWRAKLRRAAGRRRRRSAIFLSARG
jgi:hypothetical protein